MARRIQPQQDGAAVLRGVQNNRKEEKKAMTRIGELILGGCVSLAMGLFAVPAGAVTVHGCAAGQPTAASYTWNFHQEANNIFAEIQSDARQAVDHAARLQSFQDGDLSWQTQADQLNQVKAEVNDMGQKLCRLETIRGVTEPWQQNTIDRIAATMRLMADNAQDAIVFGNAHQNQLWVPTFGAYVNNLYREAETLMRSTGNAVEHAHVLREYHDLRSGLGIKASS
jgi:hypothetical protein